MREGNLHIGSVKVNNPNHPSFGGTREVGHKKPANLVRPQSTSTKDEVVSRSVAAMPVEEEA